MRRLSVPALGLALLALPLSLALPAQAATPRASVQVFATPSVMYAPVATTITVRGRVTGRSARAKVVLQKQVDNRWAAVESGKVTRKKRYVLRTKVAAGATTYRVLAKRSQRIKASRSRPFMIIGTEVVTAPTPTPTPIPTPTPTPSPTPTPTLSPEQIAINRILDDTNAFRASEGKAPLQLSSAMTTVARNWSQTMATTGVFEHNPNYSTQIPSGWSRAGENIAAGYALNSVVRGWIDSPGHRANMLGDYTHIGIGYVSRPGTTYTRYYTQVFAKY